MHNQAVLAQQITKRGNSFWIGGLWEDTDHHTQLGSTIRDSEGTH